MKLKGYHGTDRDFDAFKNVNDDGEVVFIWFAENEQLAWDYAKDKEGDVEAMYEAELEINNPLDLTGCVLAEPVKRDGKYTKDFIALFTAMRDQAGWDKEQFLEYYQDAKDMYGEEVYLFDLTKQPEFYEAIPEFDGMICRDLLPGSNTETTTTYGVRNPSQIKIINKKTTAKDESLKEGTGMSKSEDITKFIEEIYDLRRDSIANEGEYGVGNLAFKEFRNQGYLDKLRELRDAESSKELSLESLKESQSQEISGTYRKLSRMYGVDIEDLVYGKGNFMDSCYPEGFPDFRGDVIYSEKYWDEFERWLADSKGIKLKQFKQDTDIDHPEEFDEAVKMLSALDIHKYRTQICRAAPGQQPLIDRNGMFHIYNVREREADMIVNNLRRLDFIEEAHGSPSGKYDFSRMMGAGLPSRFYTISGRIKLD